MLNQDEFTGMHLIAHGDKSVFQVESLDGYQTVRRFSDKALRSGTNYKAAQVRNDLYKVGYDKLSVTKFTNCTNLGLEDNQVQKVVLQAKNVPRWYFSLTNYNNERLIVAGGLHLSTTVEIFAYIISRNQWVKIQSMNQPRSQHSACALKTRIYFVGGVDSNMRRLNTIEYIDMNSNERGSPIECMDVPRELPVFGRIASNKLVIMGGIGDVGKLDDVYIFTVNEEEWAASEKAEAQAGINSL